MRTLLETFSQKNPAVRIDMMTGPNANMPSFVKNGLVDVAFYYCIGHDHLPGLKEKFLYKEAAYLAVAPDHPLAHRTGLTCQELEKARIVYPHDSCCLFVELMRRLKNQGIHPKEVSLLGNLELVLDMVSHDEAVTLLQQYALARYEAAGKLVRLDLAGGAHLGLGNNYLARRKAAQGRAACDGAAKRNLCPKPDAGKCRPECGAIKTDK